MTLIGTVAFRGKTRWPWKNAFPWVGWLPHSFSKNMAKGLRSKIKRKNRSFLRATVTEPIIHKRQAELSLALHKTLEERKTSSLLALKKSMPKAARAAAAASLKAEKEEAAKKKEMQVEEEEESGDDEPAKVSKGKKKFSKVTGLKESFKGKGYKASRPQTKSTKELVWFK